MAIASLVLGIIGVVLCFVPIPGGGIIGLICAIVGVILGVIARKKAKEAGQPSGLATAGMILSIISLVIVAIAVIITIACVGMIGSAVGALGAM